jgi:hypothetical protein
MADIPTPLEQLRLAIAGRLLQAAGFAMYVLGAAVAIGIASGWHKIGSVDPDDALPLGAALLAGFIAAWMILSLAPLAMLRGKRRVAGARALRAWDRIERSDVPLVLYLRSFSADDETDTPVAYTIAGVGLPRLSTEEEHLAGAVRHAGCFFALGRPGEHLPMPGALRGRAERDWEAAVTRLMGRAALVIIRVGHGRSLWWEVEEALRTVSPERLVFLLPGDDTLWRELRGRLQAAVQAAIPEHTANDDAPESISAILRFERDGTPRMDPLPDAGFRATRFQPLRPMLRMGLRPVFEQLRLPWTPPPVPLQAVVPVLVLLYWGGLCGYWFVVMEPWVTLRVWNNASALEWMISLFCALLGAGMVVAALALRVRLRVLHGAVFQFSRPSPAPTRDTGSAA